MSQLDAIKEVLNTLRAGLNIITAFLIALGGALGTLYNAGSIGILFWLTSFLIGVFIFIGLFLIIRIKQKIKEIEEL